MHIRQTKRTLHTDTVGISSSIYILLEVAFSIIRAGIKLSFLKHLNKFLFYVNSMGISILNFKQSKRPCGLVNLVSQQRFLDGSFKKRELCWRPRSKTGCCGNVKVSHFSVNCSEMKDSTPKLWIPSSLVWQDRSPLYSCFRSGVGNSGPQGPLSFRFQISPQVNTPESHDDFITKPLENFKTC